MIDDDLRVYLLIILTELVRKYICAIVMIRALLSSIVKYSQLWNSCHYSTFLSETNNDSFSSYARKRFVTLIIEFAYNHANGNDPEKENLESNEKRNP